MVLTPWKKMRIPIQHFYRHSFLTRFFLGLQGLQEIQFWPQTDEHFVLVCLNAVNIHDTATNLPDL